MISFSVLEVEGVHVNTTREEQPYFILNCTRRIVALLHDDKAA